MKGKKHSAEQIIKKLREADVMMATGKSIGQVCQALEVSEQTFHRWRNQYGGMKAWTAPIFCTTGYESMGWVTGNASSSRVCCWSAGAAGAEATHAAAKAAGVW